MTIAKPYNPNAIPVMISTGIASVLAILLAISTTMKLLKKKTKLTLILSTVIYLTTAAVLMSFLGQLDWYLTTIYKHEPYLYLYSGPIGYTLVGLIILLLIRFSSIVFKWREYWFWVNVVIVGIILVVVYHPLNWWGQTVPENAINLRPLTQMLILIYVAITTIRMGINSFSAAKIASDELIKENFKDIGKAMFSIFGAFMLFLLDAIVSLLTHWEYNVVAWVSWWPIILSIFYLYRGFFARKIK